MNIKNLHIIINPASGQDEPILSYINKAFQDTSITWEISVTKNEHDAGNMARELIGKTDLIAVYGGDGTVAKVAQVLHGKQTPMAIIPGGTANVIAKELGIPQSPMQALELLKGTAFQVIDVDMGALNGEAFIIRVNFGIMADMVLEAARELKDKVGQLAYGITALQTMVKATPLKYEMLIDGEQVREEGVALTVTNCGSIGIGDYSFLPQISIRDGYLDILLLKQANLLSVLRLAGTTIMQKDSQVLQHWRCKHIQISLDKAQKVILDDAEKEVQTLDIKVIPQALKIVVPTLQGS
jgi:YegS/Rv2252/BmrU family lipid kinase